MNEREPSDLADEVIDAARAVEDAARRLCRITVSRPYLTPADVDVVLSHLAAAVASFPQTAEQLADILGRAKDRYDLSADSLVSNQDADLLIDAARLHLADVREPAVTLYRHLDAAQNQAAHVVADNRADDPVCGRRRSSRPPYADPNTSRPGHQPANRGPRCHDDRAPRPDQPGDLFAGTQQA